MRRAIVASIFAAVLCFPASAAAVQTPTVVHVWRANLDGDAHVEHVRLMLQLEPNPFGGTLPIRRHWLQVVDRVGGHVIVARISPFVEHLLPRWVQIGDFHASGRAEVFYHGFDGGAGAVPLFAGIRGWTGTAKQRLWSYAPPFRMLTHNGHRYRYDFATAALENLAAAGTPGLEVHLVQGEARPSEPDCCPSQLLIRNFRFAQGAGRWVLYQTVWRHT
jgi:hypothetical protein